MARRLAPKRIQSVIPITTWKKLVVAAEGQDVTVSTFVRRLIEQRVGAGKVAA